MGTLCKAKNTNFLHVLILVTKTTQYIELYDIEERVNFFIFIIIKFVPKKAHQAAI